MTNDPTILLSLMSRKLRGFYAKIRTRLDELGLGFIDISHGDILYQLYFRGDAPLKELARAIDRDKSTVTALVKKMEAKGLVRRYNSAEDGRITLLGLTPLGESYRDDFITISEDLFKGIYADFEEEEQHELIRLLNKLP